MMGVNYVVILMMLTMSPIPLSDYIFLGFCVCSASAIKKSVALATNDVF